MEHNLRDLSHSHAALEIIKTFAQQHANTRARQEIFNAEGALLKRPILYADAVAQGILDPTNIEDKFTLLNGDIVSTEAAFFGGKRTESTPNFIIATSTCDLIRDRRTYAALLQVKPLRRSDENIKTKISELLKFNSTKNMYLPPLPGDQEDIVANAIEFDGVAQIELSLLLNATRIASLSLVGWRVFASISRSIIARATPNEILLRQRN